MITVVTPFIQLTMADPIKVMLVTIILINLIHDIQWYFMISYYWINDIFKLKKEYIKKACQHYAELNFLNHIALFPTVGFVVKCIK